MRRPGSARRAAVALLLAALAVAAIWPVLDAGFVQYDDDRTLTENPRARAGLSPAGIRWALTAVEEGNWFPLTRLSHLADVSLYGLDPRGHHATSLALHAANAALLFLALEALTGALWPAALAAALFALHPLRVEAVAWVTERKEVLAFLFGMLALLAYARHARRPGAGRLALVTLLLGLGLAAKPVLVTLPAALLLLDCWPLGRFGPPGRRSAAAAARLLAEKLPLFALAAASSAVTWYAQRRGGAMTMLELPAGARVANAFVSCARYLGATLWPADLAVFYPHPGQWPLRAVAGAAALVAALTAAAAVLARRRPWALAGWLWFLGTLVPMLGLVQAGWQSMADRYTYLPSVGLAVVAAWGAAEAAGRGPRARAAVVAIALAALAGLAVPARLQTAVWHDSKTLFRHALVATGDNWLAHQNLGAILVNEHDPQGALVHLEAALRARPDLADIWYNIGCARLSLRERPEAVLALRQAIRLDPSNADYYGNLGVAYFSLGRLEEAAAEYRRALSLNPQIEGMRQNLEMTERLLRATRR